MQIVPVFGDEPITSSNVEVRINPDDRKRAQALVERTKAVTEVNDEETFAEARSAASELKAMLEEIELSRKQAKTPFTAIGRSIDQLAHDVSKSVKEAQDRILGMLSRYVAKLEAARAKKEREEAEARRLAQLEADRKVREAEAKVKSAFDEIARVRAQNELLQQQLAAELANDVEELGKDEQPRGLVPGGRVNHTYDFELINIQQTCEARCYRLLRWELDLLACRDSVKNQLEGFPELEPTLPGIKITKRLNVSVKAASRIK